MHNSSHPTPLPPHMHVKQEHRQNIFNIELHPRKTKPNHQQYPWEEFKNGDDTQNLEVAPLIHDFK